MSFSEFRGLISKHNSPLSTFLYYPRWKKYLHPGRTSVADRLPWITFSAIDFLKSHLNRHDKVFEFGGGGSTLFFLDRVAEVVTVEHNVEWFQILRDKIDSKDQVRWSGNLVVPESAQNSPGLDVSDPALYLSDDANYVNYNFKAYSTHIDRYPDDYFNVVLVDGRARPSCVAHAVDKIKPGGYLVLDNSDRAYYLNKTKHLLLKWKVRLDVMHPVPYDPIFTKTSIWQKPA